MVRAGQPGLHAVRGVDARVVPLQGPGGLRTACFVAALFTHGWWQLGFILGAVVLPYVAVVRVNNTGPQQAGTMRAVPAQGPALAPRPDDTAAPKPVVLTGDLVDDPRDRAPRALGRGSSSAGGPGLPGRGAA